MRPEQLVKGGLLHQVREASGGEVGDREGLGCRETREGLRPGENPGKDWGPELSCSPPQDLHSFELQGQPPVLSLSR